MKVFQNGMSCIIPSPESQQLSQIPVVVSTSSLRTWRLTREGLVELSPNSPMGNFLDNPKTTKINEYGVIDKNHIRFALGSMQGWRVEMEDAHVTDYGMGNKLPFKDWSFFAVFDGHAGILTANWSAEMLSKVLTSTSDFEKVTKKLEETNGVLTNELTSLLERGMRAGFLSLDEAIRLKMDELKDRSDRSGSTAVCAIITPTHIIIGNLGDSRAVLSKKDEEPFATVDHKPYHEKERERIIGAGGTVMIQRINGSLAVSRAFGDFEYKSNLNKSSTEQLVSPEPEIYIHERNSEIDEFLVLACDGVYDVMENQVLVDFIRGRLRVQPNLELVVNDVLDACLNKGSRDNMTMILCCFPAAPKVCPEAVEQEKMWKKDIEITAEEVVKEELQKPGLNSEDITVDSVLREVLARSESAQQGIDHLKRKIIEDVLIERQILPEPDSD